MNRLSCKAFYVLCSKLKVLIASPNINLVVFCKCQRVLHTARNLAYSFTKSVFAASNCNRLYTVQNFANYPELTNIV